MIKFFDFSRVVEKQGSDLCTAFSKVLDSHRYVLGEEVTRFEAAFASWSKAQWCIGCANGTDTIEIGLKVLEVGPEQEVITTPLTAMPTLMGIHPTGATIKLVDVDINTGLMSASAIENTISNKTKAIVPVHLYGQICDMDKIAALCAPYEIHILEDCAQAHGAIYKNKPAGSWGALSSWSFYPTKNLGAFGDGGGITGFSEQLLNKVKAYRNYGQSSLYNHEFLGRNSRLDELQAALLLVRMQLLDQEIANRRRTASIYQSELKNYIKILTDRNEDGTSLSSYHLFVALAPYDRHTFQQNMKQDRVETLVHYPIPAHQQKAFQYLGYQKGDFPNAEYLAERVISLPIHPYITDVEIEAVVSAVKNNV